MKLSGACKNGVCGLCQVHGKIRLPSGKTIRCQCGCHVPPKPKRVRMELRDHGDEED